MHLIVIVPAHNESPSIADVLRRIPRFISGFAQVSTLVVDDGSSDGTAEVARRAGATVVNHASRLGLAAAFRTGVAAALLRGADAMATIDADGQYRPEELPLLVETARNEAADLVVGNRRVLRCRHMPAGNRAGNVLGSCMLRMFAAVRVTDASSGFRFFNARLARALRINSSHTYTHEMLIQAVAYGFTVSEVDVSFLPRSHGRSKLVRTLRHHILRSCGTILRSLFLFAPLKKFLALSFGCMIIALLFFLLTFLSVR